MVSVSLFPDVIEHELGVHQRAEFKVGGVKFAADLFRFSGF